MGWLFAQFLTIVLVGLWMLLEIPGVSDLSSHALLASGALIGTLPLVFRNILRDFAAGLTVLLEDRYAIGDHVSIADLTGDQCHQVAPRLPSSPPIPPGAPTSWRAPSYRRCAKSPPMERRRSAAGDAMAQLA